MERPAFVKTDIIEKLKAAHDNVETMSQAELRAVLAEAIEITRTLRILIGIRDEIALENEPPEGEA